MQIRTFRTDNLPLAWTFAPNFISAWMDGNRITPACVQLFEGEMTGGRMADPLGVIPDDLDKYAATLRDRTTEAQGAVAYCKEWLSLPAGIPIGLYGQASGAINAICAELVANYERLAALTDGSMAELAATAQQYRVAEAASATDIGQVGE